MTLRSVHPLWHDSAQWASCAQDEASAVGSALLLGQWWHAAGLLHGARSDFPTRSAWIAWLGEIPLSESHASNLMRLYRAGLATPAFIVRDALDLLAG